MLGIIPFGVFYETQGLTNWFLKIWFYFLPIILLWSCEPGISHLFRDLFFVPDRHYFENQAPDN